MTDFFNVLEIEAKAPLPPDAFDAIRQEKIQGILVRDLLDQATCEAIVLQLETNQPGFLKTTFPDVFRSWFYGRNLNLASPDLNAYFLEAEAFNRRFDTIHVGREPLRETIANSLSALDRGRPFRSTPGEGEGQEYMFTTFRCHETQGYISAHADNEFFVRPGYQHLRTVCEPSILSFVLVFSEPEQGGATEIFDYKTTAASTSIMSDDASTAKPALETLSSVKVHIPAGSLLVFDSGHYLHRLTPIGGDKRRWTCCSFMALANDHQAMYCWG